MMGKLKLFIASIVAVFVIAAPASAAVVFRYGNVETKVTDQVPTEIRGTSEVAEVDAGNGVNCMRTADGHVLTQGGNSEGELGDNDAEPFSESAVEAALPAGVAAVSMGEAKDSCAAVTTTGQVFVAGRNGSNEICLEGTEPNYPVFTEVPGVTEATHMQGGGSHMLILLENGHVDACGTGGLGLGKKVRHVTHPTPIPGLENIVQISAGANTSAAINAAGEVFAWGGNKKGQVGNGTKKTAVSPVHIPLPCPAKEVSVGGDNLTDGHVEVLLTCGRVFGWGQDEAGDIGDGSKADKLSPVEATELMSVANITYVISSGTNTMVQDEAGEVFSLGLGKFQGTLTDESSFTPQLIATGAEEISGTARNQAILK
jgi:alpha-tubulin suppressor-like RCC1 family protein